MKTCTNCAEQKGFERFTKSAGMADGHLNQCKDCVNARLREKRRANPEATRAACQAWRDKHPERMRASAKKWRQANPEAVREQTRKWQRENPEKNMARMARWKKANPIGSRLYASRRRVREAGRTLGCSDEALRAVYERARLLTLVTGVKHHVDHEIPLGGRGVCGLHVPWNLRCIPATDNHRKSNKLELA